MKNKFLVLTVILMASVFANAQNTPESKCGTMEYLQKQKDADPGLEIRMQILEEKLQQWIRQNPNNNKLNKKASITIPVVVHIVYSADSQNISDQRVFDQIAVSNKSFAGQNPHSIGAFSSALKANCNIQFCLAKKKPNGASTNGIERRNTTVASFTGNAVKSYSTGGLDAWDPTKYLNIWVCNYSFSDGSPYVFSAYAQFPGTGVNATYGIVIRYGAFGPADSTYYRGNGGCITHELGHCLNLHHIWGDDTTSCRGTDYCDDTPNQAGRTTGIHTGVLTDACSASSPGIMYMNFMDYSDDIVYANFTPNQATRMQANFTSPNGLLLSLANSDACSTPSACESPNTLTASISGAKATLGWRAMYGATKYNIRYRIVGVSSWTSATSNTNSTSINKVTNNKSYEFQVQTVCSGGTSSFCPSKVFSTSGNGNFVTGVEQSDVNSGITLFPNPAKEQVTLSCYTSNSENAEIRLFDITGRTIKTEKFTTLQGENNHVLDLKMINKGMYFVEFTIPGYERTIKKLIIE